MPNAAVQRYRLTIGTPLSGTLICIGATRDEEAMSKAERIFAHLSDPDAAFRLQRASGAIISDRPPASRPA